MSNYDTDECSGCGGQGGAHWDGCHQLEPETIIEESELDARFAKLRAENLVVRSLCDHGGYGLEGLLEELAKKNPRMRAEILEKLEIRESTIYVDTRKDGKK